MSIRQVALVKGEIYHIFSKSIAEFRVFNNDGEYNRMRDALLYYSTGKPACSFSFFRKSKKDSTKPRSVQNNSTTPIVEVVTYCIMPTHIHMILKEISEDGISKFMELILKSYSHYFNIKYSRKGPLWESRFQNVLIKDDDQFIHLTRYIHLNPVTAYLVNDPADWKYSSYQEYIGLIRQEDRICQFSKYLTMDISSYKKFVTEQIDYQRKLASAKKLPFQNPVLKW